MALQRSEQYIKRYHREDIKFNNEICILQLCKHKNIIEIIQHYYADTTNIPTIITKKCGISLDHILEQNMEYNCDSIILDVVSGLKYLSNLCIAHMNIKPDNIVYDGKIAKIIDFGSSVFIYSDYIMVNNLKSECTHTPPEYIPNSTYEVSLKYDVWSLAIVIYELKNNIMMYQHNSLPGLSDMAEDKDIEEYNESVIAIMRTAKMRRKILTGIPINLWRCLESDASIRMSIDDVYRIITS